MTQLVSYILIELIPVAALLLLGAVVYGIAQYIQYRSKPSKTHLASCDYILFEAEPVNMAYIEADLAENGWRLVDTRATETEALLCRFEKAGAASRCLSEIFEFDRCMPRTFNRTVGALSAIKIKGHGSRGNGDL